MKVLFIVQGEGRGHLTQALALERMLNEAGHEVVEMLVGQSPSREVPQFFLDRVQTSLVFFDSPNFQPSSDNCRVSCLRSMAYNLLRTPAYMESMLLLRRRIKDSGAQLVVNFYEVLCGLTYALFRPSVPQVCIGHQYLFLHPEFQMPKGNKLSQQLLLAFTRVTSWDASRRLALSLHDMDADDSQRLTVIPPLLRPEVSQELRHRGNYITGYILNAGYADYVMAWHKEHPQTHLHFFWDKKGAPRETRIDDTLTFHQLDDTLFIKYLANCRAYATTGGFESICEAFYMGKPVLMVPVHTEQECNAHDAEHAGAGIVDDSFSLDRLLAFTHEYMEDVEFRQWENRAARLAVRALEDVFTENSRSEEVSLSWLLPRYGVPALLRQVTD